MSEVDGDAAKIWAAMMGLESRMQWLLSENVRLLTERDAALAQCAGMRECVEAGREFLAASNNEARGWGRIA